MFEILGDKKQLYQWDRDRKISVPKGVTKIGFSNLTHGVSKDVIVDGDAVVIPPEILRIHGDLYVWGSDEYNTDYSSHFDVIKRPKPADYVYTPEELKAWEDLQNQIGDLKNLKTEQKDNLVSAINEALLSAGADPEYIAEVVREYLAENPPEIEEADPTVSDWAKQPTKPTYTASEVGALSQDELQNGINTALRQAKESGQFNGADGKDGNDYVLTEADKDEIADIVGENIDLPSGGGGGGYELFTVVAEGGETFLGFTLAELGMADVYDCEAIQLYAYKAQYTTEDTSITGDLKFNLRFNNGTYFYGSIGAWGSVKKGAYGGYFSTSKIVPPIRYTKKNTQPRREALASMIITTANKGVSGYNHAVTAIPEPTEYTSGYYIWLGNEAAKFTAGTTFCIKVWR